MFFLIKTALKDIMSLLLYPFLKIRGLFQGRQGVRVLVYHCIGNAPDEWDGPDMNISRELFGRQMEYLFKANYNVISLNELCDYIKGKKKFNSERTICITFDDTFNNDYTILKKFGFKATVFAVYNFVEKKDWALSWNQLKQLANDGFSIGSHGKSHRKLAKLDMQQLKEEIIDSKEMLENRLSGSIDFFAYPFGCAGSFNQTTEDIIKKAGFSAAFINIMGTNRKGADLFTLKRTRICPNDNLWRFRLKLDGAYDWIDCLNNARIARC